MTVPRIIHPDVRPVFQQPLTVGESPVWDEETGTLWFVDILAPALVRLSPSGQIDRFDMPAAIGCLGLCRDHRIAVALQTGVHLFDPASSDLEFLCDPVGRGFKGRLNDGKVGPDGHFWMGSISEAKPQVDEAALYRVGADGSTRTVATGLTSSNGLAWSPDGRRMYHSDSRQCFLRAFDFDPDTGDLGDGRRLRSFTEDEGRPDGATTDRDGFYWSAGVSAGRLNRISPEGDIVEIYILPVAAPTMPCFGGPDLRTLYVTSLSTDRTGHFEAGTVIAFDVDAEGLAPFRFG
jgi:sugar lactone lactonase YvrE